MEVWKSGTFLLISYTERYHLLFAIWMVVVYIYSTVCFPRSGEFYIACLRLHISSYHYLSSLFAFFSVRFVSVS